MDKVCPRFATPSSEQLRPAMLEANYGNDGAVYRLP